MTDDDVLSYTQWDNNRLKGITNMIVEYFPKTMFFHTIIVTLVALRSPTDFAVTCTIFAMLMRITMVFGYYSNKKAIYIGASGMEIAMNLMLMFITMSYSQFC